MISRPRRRKGFTSKGAYSKIKRARFCKAVLYPELEAEQTEDEAGLGADYGYEGYELDELSDESYSRRNKDK